MVYLYVLFYNLALESVTNSAEKKTESMIQEYTSSLKV